MATQQPAADTVFSVSDIIDHPGMSRTVNQACGIPQDLELPLTTLTQPVTVDLSLDVLVDGIMVRGDITVACTQQCALCLTTIPEATYTHTVSELFTTAQENPEAQDDGTLIEDAAIDLDLLLRDAIVEVVPPNRLCTPDCLGLCPTCGIEWNHQHCDHHTTQAQDTRWEALKGLTLSDESSQ